MFASGYIEHVAGPRGQKVVILQGGFEAYADTAKKEHCERRLLIQNYYHANEGLQWKHVLTQTKLFSEYYWGR